MDPWKKLITIVVTLVVIHYHGVLPLSYIIQVDGSLEEAQNYCRNIGDDPLPWCITTDEEKFYQHCYEHICAGQTNNMQTLYVSFV